MEDEHHPTLCPPNGMPKLGHTNRRGMMPLASRPEAASQPSPVRANTTIRPMDPRSSQSPTSGVSGLTSVNSQLYQIVINGCENVRLQGLRVLVSGINPNTDGIQVQLSRNVMILNSEIGIGDDCASIGAGKTDLSIHNVVCGPGHGISLGKGLDEIGVQNVTVTSVTFTNT
ncbi:hypothetical protein Cgig2_006385 [Carnegiea gigantea]|uniref:Polygalacturonase n=1 Tax=Carnegiea gigantea TaxID=171969 RepID=A0A9Q1K599_9CARY|nr:hypothetical protein Cgig2_006385 [Carnegiea gigantea]